MVSLTIIPRNSINREVAFLLHNSFEKAIWYTRAINGEAKLALSAYEDFTLGACTSDGTMLELDLNKVKGYPEGFYYKEKPKSKTPPKSKPTPKA